MANALDTLFTLRRAGRVKRMHTEWVAHEENLAEHSSNVALLVDWMLPDASKELLRAALYHDLAEYSTGDIPANTKWAAPEVERTLNKLETRFRVEHGIQMSLAPWEQSVLKFADKLDLSLYCYEEITERGNRGLIRVRSRIDSHIQLKIDAGEWFTPLGVKLFSLLRSSYDG